MMHHFIDEETSLTLITAPETVRTAYIKTGDWLGWWISIGNPHPSTEAIDASFWLTFARLDGTDEDFAWMVQAGLCDESDRVHLNRIRATV